MHLFNIFFKLFYEHNKYIKIFLFIISSRIEPIASTSFLFSLHSTSMHRYTVSNQQLITTFINKINEGLKLYHN